MNTELKRLYVDMHRLKNDIEVRIWKQDDYYTVLLVYSCDSITAMMPYPVPVASRFYLPVPKKSIMI